MATVNSNLVANSIAAPIVKNNVTNSGGNNQVEYATVTLAAGDLAINNVLRIARLPSNAIVRNIEIYNINDLDSGTAAVFKVGLNKTDGTVGDDDVFGAGQTNLQGTNPVWTSIYKPAIADFGKQAFAAAGLATESVEALDLVITITTAATTNGSAGTFACRVEWSHN